MQILPAFLTATHYHLNAEQHKHPIGTFVFWLPRVYFRLCSICCRWVVLTRIASNQRHCGLFRLGMF